MTITVVVKTQDDAPSRMNLARIVLKRNIKLHHLLLFDNAGNVVNEEDHEARPILIRMGLAIPRKNIPTSLVPHPHTRQEDDQALFP